MPQIIDLTNANALNRAPVIHDVSSAGYFETAVAGPVTLIASTLQVLFNYAHRHGTHNFLTSRSEGGASVNVFIGRTTTLRGARQQHQSGMNLTHAGWGKGMMGGDAALDVEHGAVTAWNHTQAFLSGPVSYLAEHTVIRAASKTRFFLHITDGPGGQIMRGQKEIELILSVPEAAGRGRGVRFLEIKEAVRAYSLRKQPQQA